MRTACTCSSNSCSVSRSSWLQVKGETSVSATDIALMSSWLFLPGTSTRTIWCCDFATKREIIRALVKRIEIHKEEIIVVFRVDPDPGLDVGEGSTDSQAGKQGMQDR